MAGLVVVVPLWVSEAVWTRESATRAVLAFVERNGYQPVSREAGTGGGLPCFDAAVRLFGSWNGMIREAGFVPYPARNSALAKKLARRDRTQVLS